MKRFPAWLTYTVLRLLFIAVPLVVLLLLLGTSYWIFSAIVSVIIGFCLSYLFLRRPRQEVAQQLADANKRDRRKAKASTDDEVEDAIDDATRRTE